jgi:hypothetical protein
VVLIPFILLALKFHCFSNLEIELLAVLSIFLHFNGLALFVDKKKIKVV